MPARRTVAASALSLVLALLAGCGPSPTTATQSAARSEQTLQPAVGRIGEARIRASVVPTAMLNPATARQYGIERSPHTVLLLVGVRTGPEMQETSLPARISGNVIDLRGVRRPIELREVRSGDPGADPEQVLLDYVGIVRVTPPDTLRFDLEIADEDGARADLRFSRDIYPQ